MADSFVQVAPDGTGKKLDSDEVTVGAHLVHRQRVIAIDADLKASGVVTIINSNPSGAATPGSAVELALASGHGSLAVQVTGVYTGALSLQGTVNGTNWVTIGGTPFINVATGAHSATIASAAQGIFLADCSAFTALRITGLAAMTGSASITLEASDSASMVALDVALPAGTNSIGTVVLGAGSAAIGSVTPVTPTTTFTNSAASTNSTLIKNSAGTLWNITANNTNAAVRYLKLYNLATAPVVGTTVPVLVIPIPAGGFVNISGGSNGLRFPTGIGIGITTGAADNDTGAVAAGEVKVATSFT